MLAETYEKDAAKGTESMLDETYTDDDNMRNSAKSLDTGKLNSDYACHLHYRNDNTCLTASLGMTRTRVLPASCSSA